MATQGSWPSIAFIIWRYKADYRLPTGETYTFTTASACDGTLITTRKILTAGKLIRFKKMRKLKLFSFNCSFYKKKKAHCIPTKVTFSSGSVSYTMDVKTSTYYPTFGSMFSVYLGLHNKTSIVNSGTYSAPTIKVTVSEQRLVSKEIIFIIIIILVDNPV